MSDIIVIVDRNILLELAKGKPVMLKAVSKSSFSPPVEVTLVEGDDFPKDLILERADAS